MIANLFANFVRIAGKAENGTTIDATLRHFVNRFPTKNQIDFAPMPIVAIRARDSRDNWQALGMFVGNHFHPLVNATQPIVRDE